MSHKLDHPSQQKLGIEMGLYQRNHCQIRLKRTEKKRAERKEDHQTFYRSRTIEFFSCEHVLFFQKGKNDSEGNSEIIRAVSSVSKGYMALDKSCGDRPAWNLGGGIATPVSLEGRHQFKEDYS